MVKGKAKNTADEKTTVRLNKEDGLFIAANSPTSNPFHRLNGDPKASTFMAYCARAFLTLLDRCGQPTTGNLEKDLAVISSSSLNLPNKLYNYLDWLVENEFYKTRVDAITDLVRDGLKKGGWKSQPYQKPPEEEEG